MSNYLSSCLSRVICKYKSRRLTSLIDEGGGRIVIAHPSMRLRITKRTGAKLVIRGVLCFRPSLDGDERTSIYLGEGSTMQIDGDFEMGNAVRIWLDTDAFLSIGGRKTESGSGITSNSTILVRKRVVIGRDFICAWQTFITDCDWHNFNGEQPQRDVHIGDKVWLAHNSSVHKGVSIPDGCVVAAHSLVLRGEFAPNSLLAGTPACAKRSRISWHRDMTE